MECGCGVSEASVGEERVPDIGAHDLENERLDVVVSYSLYVPVTHLQHTHQVIELFVYYFKFTFVIF